MFKKLTLNGTVWTIRKDAEPLILDNLYAKLNSYGSDPEFTLLKDNNVRSAFIFKTAGSINPEVFVKRYKCRGFKDVLKHFLVPSKAVSEWRALKKFEERHLPCPSPIAFSEKKTFGMLKDSCLITEALSNAVPINNYIKNIPDPARQKKGLTKSLAALVRDLHLRGVFYRDLHAGNILIKLTGSNPELFFIDLHRAAVLPKLFRWMRTRDLAQLCNSLPASRADKLRFLKEYCEGEYLSENSFRRFQKKIFQNSLKSELRRIKSRSKRCLKNSTIFEKSTSRHETYFGRRDFKRGAAVRAEPFSAPDKTSVGDKTIKSSSKSVLRIYRPGNAKALCIKKYRFIGALYCLKNLFRKSRALKSWIAANSLLVRGINTPLPQAMVEKKWGPLKIESFFITQWLPDAAELNDYVNRLNNRCKKEAFIKEFALTIRKLHLQGVFHADLKSNNILVKDNGNTGWTFYFVDLDRVSFKKNLTFIQKADNLAQINASVSSMITLKDRLKFFHFYANGTPSFSARKKYYRKILTISRTKITAPYGITFT